MAAYFIRAGQAVPTECLSRLANGAEIVFGDRAESFQRQLASERLGRNIGLMSLAAVRVAELAFPPTIMRSAVLTSAHTLPFSPRSQDELSVWTSAIFNNVRLAQGGELEPIGCNYLIAQDAPRDGMLMIQWGEGVDSSQVLRVAREIEEETDYALKTMQVGAHEVLTPAPSAGDDLQSYVSQLIQVHARERVLTGSEAWRIGEQINERHGYKAMIYVCDTIRAKLGGGPARELEVTWDGIGDWMG